MLYMNGTIQKTPVLKMFHKGQANVLVGFSEILLK